MERSPPIANIPLFSPKRGSGKPISSVSSKTIVEERLKVNGERLKVNGERLKVNGERLKVNGERLMLNEEWLKVNVDRWKGNGTR